MAEILGADDSRDIAEEITRDYQPRSRRRQKEQNEAAGIGKLTCGRTALQG
jgi:hypothetical protein